MHLFLLRPTTTTLYISIEWFSTKHLEYHSDCCYSYAATRCISSSQRAFNNAHLLLLSSLKCIFHFIDVSLWYNCTISAYILYIKWQHDVLCGIPNLWLLLCSGNPLKMFKATFGLAAFSFQRILCEFVYVWEITIFWNSNILYKYYLYLCRILDSSYLMVVLSDSLSDSLFTPSPFVAVSQIASVSPDYSLVDPMFGFHIWILSHAQRCAQRCRCPSIPLHCLHAYFNFMCVCVFCAFLFVGCCRFTLLFSMRCKNKM